MTMNKIVKGVAIGLVLSGLILPAWGQKHPRELGPAPELEFKLENPVEFTLSNGVRCFYMEDRELPLITLSGVFKGGSLHVAPEKTGLASLLGTVLRTGGTKTLTGDAINEELEFIAASIRPSVSWEHSVVTGSSLKKDFAKLVELYADIIMNPEFRQDKIDLAKNQSLESMRRRWVRPSQAASMLFSEKLYGADSPFGRRSTPATLQAVSREDLIAFHEKYFVPNNFYLGITGDISLEEAKAALEKAFKGWKTKKVDIPAVPKLMEKADGTVYYAYKDTPQGNVYMGHLGIEQRNPDEFKIEMMNEILGGGGFTARLMKELRSNRGLTYGIYGGVYEGPAGVRGPFRISSQLKAAQFVEALELIKGIIEDMQTNPVSDEEITTAKNSLINSFVFRFQTKGQILRQFMNLKIEGYPDNYLEAYIDNIRKVTKKDVQEAAKKYMDTAKMIFVVVGDEKKFDKPLSSIGTVKAIDLQAIIDAEKGPGK